MRHDLGLRIAGLHIDMGLGEYSAASLAVVQELTGTLGVPLVLERVADHGVEIASAGNFPMCSVCGAVRRALLDRVGLREGWAAVATGHTLDDRLQQMLKRLLTGRLDAPRPVLPGDEFHPRKVKPLSFIPDRAIEAYARLVGVPVVAGQCSRFDPQSHRLKQVFELLEELAPSGKLQLIHTLQKAMRQPSPGGPETPCPGCGNPTASGICPLCRLKELTAEE
jgi:tRNA(Ile)-lysidine synthase TilS/MesJ